MMSVIIWLSKRDQQVGFGKNDELLGSQNRGLFDCPELISVKIGLAFDIHSKYHQKFPQ